LNTTQVQYEGLFREARGDDGLKLYLVSYHCDAKLAAAMQEAATLWSIDPDVLEAKVTISSR
jgi:hypothetical protein